MRLIINADIDEPLTSEEYERLIDVLMELGAYNIDEQEVE